MKCCNPLSGYQHRLGGKLLFTSPPGRMVDYRPMTVPCGSCVFCRLNQSRVWAARMCMEAELHDANCFLTLTYDDDHLPFANQLEKKHVQDFIKRLRSSLVDNPIRYYYVGEYGDRTGRPHYHILLFGYDFSDTRVFLKKSKKGFSLWSDPLLDRIWDFGFVNIGEFNFESAAYCARYCLKKRVGSKDYAPEELYCDIKTGEVFFRVEEFGQSSTRPGIGALWYEKFGADVRRTDFVVMRGKRMLPPRYFDKLTQRDYSSDYQRIKDDRTCNFDQVHISCEQSHELRMSGAARVALQKTRHLKGSL